MKKTISILLVIALLFSFNTAFADQNVIESDFSSAQVSQELFESLGFYMPLLDFEDTVTGLDFTVMLLNLFGVVTDNSSEEEIAKHAEALNFAIPNYDYTKEITYSEAAMMCVAAAGFVPEASSGGYTVGSAVVAKKMKLLKPGTYSYDAPMTYADVLYMLEALGNVNIRYQSHFGAVEKFTVTDGYTPLYVYHNVYTVEGVITANENSSVYMASDACDKGKIQIDETLYDYNGKVVLGEKVSAYVRDDGASESLLCYRSESESITIRPEDIFEVDAKAIRYSDNGKEKHKNLDGAVLVIYNGKAYPECKLSDYMISDGSLTLIDNDDDGKSDVVHIREYNIVYTKSNDTHAETISDNNSNYSLNYASSDINTSVWNGDVLIVPETIKKGSILEAYISKDGLCAEIFVSDKKTISGTVREIDETNKKIGIDGVMYGYNKYFEQHYLKYCTLSKKVSIIIDSFGKLSVMSGETGNDFPFGLLIASRRLSGIDSKVEVKLFSADNEVGIYEIAENIRVDGNLVSEDEFVSRFSEVKSGNEMLVRYKLKGGKLTEIVTPSQSSSIITEEQEETALVRYMFSGKFENKGQNRFGTLFYTNAATPVFSIIDGTDLEDEEKYTTADPVTSGRIFNDGGAVEIEAYNVNNTRKAGAIIWHRGGAASMLTKDSPSGLVVSVTEAMVPLASGDSFPGKKVTLCVSGTFYEYYLTDDKPWRNVTKADPEDEYPICPGDIIRYSVNGSGHFVEISKDFEFKTKTIYNNGTYDKGLYYVFGKIIHNDGGMAIIDNQTDLSVSDVPDFNGTTFIPLPGNVMLFDTKLGKVVDPIFNTDSIRTSKYSLAECDYVLCTTTDGYGAKAIVYR